MPIRFRCAYCNQLLGISRRKSGTVVRCPTCAGQVVVPNVESEEAEKSANPGDHLIFERSDFEELFNPQDEGAAPAQKNDGVLTEMDAPVAIPSSAGPLPGAWGTHAEPAYDVEKLRPTPAASPPAATSVQGVVLSPAKATFFVIVVVVALALAFGTGFAVGFFLRPVQEPQTPSQGLNLRTSAITLASLSKSAGADAGSKDVRGYGLAKASRLPIR